jgi:2',3'-cyclic-nucleotide 2'-phosphodiesterase (5'-nucleotidase family)
MATLVWVCGALALVSLTGCSTSEEPSGPAKPLVVIFTSDEHSQLFAAGPELDDFPLATAATTGPMAGGMARRATLIQQARQDAAAANEDLLLLSAGDNQMGCLSEVAFESDALDLELMTKLGYDATTLGNHEFDFGPKALATALGAGAAKSKVPPIVASNIHFSGTAGDADLAALYSDDAKDSAVMHAYRVIDTERGVRIGLVGYVGVNASFVAPNKAPVAFSEQGLDPSVAGDGASVLPNLYADLQPVVDRLRHEEGVKFVIALAHGGVNGSADPADLERSDDWSVCRNVRGIDFIVSGHAHNADPTPIDVVNAKDHRHCLVLNASALGRHLGRVHFRVPADASESVAWDDTNLTLVDESVVPDPEMAASTLDAVATIERQPYLPNLLERVTGAPVSDNVAQPGDLYFVPIAQTSFDVTDTHMVLYLSADAMLSAADEWGKAQSLETNMGLESAGVIRTGLVKGKTGVISAADAFDVVPLGASPVDGSIGYPLVRASVSLFELRAVFEFSRAQGRTNSDYDLGTSGVRVEYDATRPLVEVIADLLDPAKGQVMRILLDSDHSDGFEQFDEVIYDREQGVQKAGLFSVVTSSYIAQFADTAGVTLKDDAGGEISIEQAILMRADQSELKQIESFLGYLHAMPGAALADRYDRSSASHTERWACVKGC